PPSAPSHALPGRMPPNLLRAGRPPPPRASRAPMLPFNEGTDRLSTSESLVLLGLDSCWTSEFAFGLVQLGQATCAIPLRPPAQDSPPEACRSFFEGKAK